MSDIPAEEPKPKPKAKSRPRKAKQQAATPQPEGAGAADAVLRAPLEGNDEASGRFAGVDANAPQPAPIAMPPSWPGSDTPASPLEFAPSPLELPAAKVEASPATKPAPKAEVKAPPRDNVRLVPAGEGLVVTRIGKSFRQRPVVRGVTMRLRRGEVVGLLGPNGAGKTTCFYMMTGLIPVDYGTIELDGVDVTHLPMFRRARLGVGYLPQEASIFRGLTVEENVRAVVELHEKNPVRRDQIVNDLLAEFSITHLARTSAVALSGGERRRVEIARALASSPSFMLLDEPFAGIDPIAVGDIRALVMQLKARGIGVLITDHNVRETLEIIDRAYIMHDGLVIKEGGASDIVRDKDVRRLYLGEKFSL